MSQQSTSRRRPFGVTLLAIGAGILTVLSVIHTLQALAILPYFIGPIAVRGFNLWNALMWGLMVWVWIWVTRMLWRVDPQAWLFLVVITVFNLILNFTVMLGAATWSDVSLSFIINGLILIYCMLPGVKEAFGTN
jgi:hypothetical protein